MKKRKDPALSDADLQRCVQSSSEQSCTRRFSMSRKSISPVLPTPTPPSDFNPRLPHQAADETPNMPSIPFNENSIQNYQQLLAALAAKKVQITLGSHIIAPDNIVINYDVALNFNGFNIISEESRTAARVLDIRSGEVTLTGQGKIFAMGAQSSAIRVFGAISTGMPHYTKLTIDEQIELYAPDSYGILISPNLGVAYGLTLNFSGKIIAQDGIGLSSGIHGRDHNLPVINIKSNARIVADETSGIALDAAGYAVWQIDAAKLSGATGLNLSSGRLHLAHTQVVASGQGDAQGSEISHAAIKINPDAQSDLEVTIDGGTYIGEKSYAIAGNPESIKKFVIKDGEFSGAVDVLHDVVETHLDIEEGSFSPHPALFLKILHSKPALLPAPEPEPEVALSSLIVDAPEPVPIEIPEEREDPAITAERSAMRTALAEAISEMEGLRAADYESGYRELRRVIQAAREILASDDVELSDIRDAAGRLLSAFDNLKERDEFSLSDDELDQLFYHGTILNEVARPSEELDFEPEPIPTPEPAPILESKVEMPLDYTMLSEAIQVISGLTPDDFTAETYNQLINDLNRAKLVTATEQIAQSAIDEITSALLADLSKLERIEIAPILQPAIMIDESDPYLTLYADKIIVDSPASRVHSAPISSFFKSFATGFRAGFDAFKQARESQ